MNSTSLILILGLGDFKRDGAAPGQLVNVHDRFYLCPGITVFFVKLLNLLAVGEQFLLIERLAGLDRDFFADFGIAELFVALDFDVGQPRVDLDNVSQHHAAIVGLVQRDANVVKLSRRVKRLDVVLGDVGPVNIAGFGADMGTDELLADRRGTGVFDVHAVNFGAGHLRPRDRRAAEQQPDSEKAKK
jgi:hypothetical protein